jgi:hypothetical protein
MKNIYKFSLIGVLFLVGCATNVVPNNPVKIVSTSTPSPMKETAPIRSKTLARKLNDCIVQTNQSADALLVDSQIIVVTRDNPHSGTLFNSHEKLTDQQANALSNYLAEANKCRSVATEGLNPQMVEIYHDFFAKLDRVYADLISRKITIGVANQERQLLIQDARLKRMAIQSKQN